MPKIFYARYNTSYAQTKWAPLRAYYTNMAHAEVRPTAFHLAFPERNASRWPLSFFQRSRLNGQRTDATALQEQDPEYKLPKFASLFVVLFTSGLLQVS